MYVYYITVIHICLFMRKYHLNISHSLHWFVPRVHVTKVQNQFAAWLLITCALVRHTARGLGVYSLSHKTSHCESLETATDVSATLIPKHLPNFRAIGSCYNNQFLGFETSSRSHDGRFTVQRQKEKRGHSHIEICTQWSIFWRLHYRILSLDLFCQPSLAIGEITMSLSRIPLSIRFQSSSNIC